MDGGDGGAWLALVFALATLAAAVWLVRRAWRQARARQAAYRKALAEFRWSADMTPRQFERCCADYLAGRGWTVRTTQASGDQGVDVDAVRGGERLVIQCKLYRKPVGNRAVQEAIAGRAFTGARHAAVVTNSTFTPAARELARRADVMLLHFTELARCDTLTRPGQSPRPAGR